MTDHEAHDIVPVRVRVEPRERLAELRDFLTSVQVSAVIEGDDLVARLAGVPLRGDGIRIAEYVETWRRVYARDACVTLLE